MSVCPKCKGVNDEGTATCSQCNSSLNAPLEISATIDQVGPIVADEELRMTLPEGAKSTQHDLDFEAEGVDANDATQQTITVNTPWNPVVTAKGTVIAQANSEHVDRTVEANEPSSLMKDIGATQVLDDSPGSTIGSTLRATTELPIDATMDLDSLSSASPSDAQATLIFDTVAPKELKIDQTIIFGSEGTDPGTHGEDHSGTQGRLKRMWEGAVGSSANPLHSLSAISLQASDTIFERVATRKVVDANSPTSSDADYKIIDKLGEGAMGIVFTARQTTVDRLVALKAAKPKFQKNQDARRRFLYEAQITADLDHSNIVPIHELGSSEDGMLFYSMKIVEGDQWNRVMTKKTREQNLDIFMKVADAVAFAHSKGIIHRDLKPENTMLGRFGEVFVTDWGTAVNLRKDTSAITSNADAGERRLTVESTEHFRSGDSVIIVNDDEVFERNEVGGINGHELLLRKKTSRAYVSGPGMRVVKAINMAGTPCYMAPEMAGHQLNRLGPASDIYVLGGILFDMITGRPPHTGPSVTHCLKNALENGIEVPDAAGDDALLKIALKAMSTAPKDRYLSVGDMQDAVRQYRRHAESISLANRSSLLLQKARASSDYETFSRALFGFRDAIEMWPENTVATSGLAGARREYGEVAYAKGDYDLVLETVDRDIEDENALYERAAAAKQKRIDREARLKGLQRAVAAIVICSIAGLSALSIYASQKKNEAEENAATAVAAANNEKAARTAAEKSASEERLAKEAAETAKLAALQAAEAEKKATIAANEAKDKAVAAEKEAKIQRDLAREQAVAIQLDNYKSTLPLAKSQLDSFDIGAARDNLSRLQSTANSFAEGARPSFDTWGWQRINLLSNADLPHGSVGSSPLASTAAKDANRFAIANSDGKIQVYDATAQGSQLAAQFDEIGATSISMTMSPDGKQLAYVFTNAQTSGVKLWSLDSQDPIEIPSAKGRRLQNLAFSSDGKNLVAGINAGIWVWNLNGDWQTQPSQRIEKVRGDLVSLQAISPTKYLMLVDFQNRREARVLDISTGSNESINIPEGVEGSITCALMLNNGQQIAMGLSDNQIVVADFKWESNSLDHMVALEDKHTAPVTSLRQDSAGRLISSSTAEPVAHVWHQAANQWQYLSSLTGLKHNLHDVLTLSAELSTGIDDAGEFLLWDIPRQLKRGRMERTAGNGVAELPPSPIHELALGKFNEQALTIDSNGIVDLWSLADGSTQSFPNDRFSYFGHTPGAELVDTAASVESKYVVTSARLNNAERKYLTDPTASWEFCLWDMGSCSMLRRWTHSDSTRGSREQQGVVEPRLSLIDHGRKLLIASDVESRVIDLASGNDVFSQDNFGTYFAASNPKDDAIVLLVKRSGAIRILDWNNLAQWDSEKQPDDKLRTTGDMPLRAVWTEDGKRFYVVYASGNIAKVNYGPTGIDVAWTSFANQVDGVTEALSSQLGRTTSHLNVDLAVTTNDKGDELHYAIRSVGTNVQTKYVAIEFPLSVDQQPSAMKNELVDGIRWLKANGNNQLKLVEKLNEQFEVDYQRIKTWQHQGPSIFVSNRSAQTYAITEGVADIQQFGRMSLKSAVGDNTGRILYCLFGDDSIWKFSLEAGKMPRWTKLKIVAHDVKSLALSADGKLLSLLGSKGVGVWDLKTDQSVANINSTVVAAWASSESTLPLATCSADGTITLLDNDWQVAKTINHPLQAGEEVVGLHFYQETWADQSQAPRRHLLLHTRTSVGDIVTLHAIDPSPLATANEPVENKPVSATIAKNSVLTTSPKEGVFVSGTENGTVTVWFCMPTWGAPRQLFELDGHRGASITTMKFTTDAKTLVTADSKNRLYAWLSRDPNSN